MLNLNHDTSVLQSYQSTYMIFKLLKYSTVHNGNEWDTNILYVLYLC